MAYDTTEAVAKFLSGFQMKITERERDTVAPDYYVKYLLTLSKGGKDFSTTFVSDPRAFGEPTVTQVFSALADDALTLRKYSTDEFVDKLYAQGVKPSAALRAYDSCKETNLWMQDELYLSGWEIEEISKTLTKHEDEVNTLVEKAASERAARYAYDHPKLPKGFVTIEQLQGDLDLGDLRDEVEDFDFDGDLTAAFSETADYKVDDNYHALLSWLPDHTEWLEQAEFYDTEDNGQFVASFHMNTLLGYPWNGMVGADLDGLEAHGFAYPLSTQAATDWLEGDDLAKVNAFLKETCKEVFGILPGADDGGYSLSGEAREAALRFALPENRKAALDVIRKLNESRDSNENAL